MMNIKSGDRILTVAANGAHALSKLLADPKEVVALDVSVPQLHMAKLQATGMQLLSRSEFCALIGVNRRDIAASERLKLYEYIRNALKPDTKLYWDKCLNYIEDGLLYCGRVERIIDEFSESTLPGIHDDSTIKQYLELGDDMDEQLRFHNEIWNSEPWRKEYPDMRNRCLAPIRGPITDDVDIGMALLKQFDRMVKHVPNNKNEFLEALLTSDITGKRQLPEYLREGNYEFIKERLNRITWIIADIAGYIGDVSKRKNASKFDGINFTTAPIYMEKTPEKLNTMMNNAAVICNTGSKLVYYALEEFNIYFPEAMMDKVIKYDGQDNTFGIFTCPTMATIL